MKQYPIPKHLEKKLTPKAIRALMSRPLNALTYVETFKNLLHLEECQMNIDIRNYDLSGVELTESQSKYLLFLKVPGLAEKRPSVLYGDAVYVRSPIRCLKFP